MFLTPDGKPFFGGTYFPKRRATACRGSASCSSASRRSGPSNASRSTRRATSSCDALARDAAARRRGRRRAGGLHRRRALARALRDALMRGLRRRRRRLRRRAEVPAAIDARALLRYAVGRRRRRSARRSACSRCAGWPKAASTTSSAAASAATASTREWTIPHFEKMLYDNGPLLRLYAEAWLLDRASRCSRQVCERTARLGDARDAVAARAATTRPSTRTREGEEGKFYVWKRDEVARAARRRTSTRSFAAHYGLDAPPNFEGQAWHLRVARPLAEVAAATRRAPRTNARRCSTTRERVLFAARETRVRPGRDEKILTSWNALMIDGMALAARVFGRAGLGRVGAARARFPAHRDVARRPACSPRTRTAARTSTPTSTTTRSCSPRCSN